MFGKIFVTAGDGKMPNGLDGGLAFLIK